MSACTFQFLDTEKRERERGITRERKGEREGRGRAEGGRERELKAKNTSIPDFKPFVKPGTDKL